MRLQCASPRVSRRGCVRTACVGLEEGHQDYHDSKQSQVSCIDFAHVRNISSSLDVVDAYVVECTEIAACVQQ